MKRTEETISEPETEFDQLFKEELIPCMQSLLENKKRKQFSTQILRSVLPKDSTHMRAHTRTHGENYKFISFMSRDANFKTKYQQIEFDNM